MRTTLIFAGAYGRQRGGANDLVGALYDPSPDDVLDAVLKKVNPRSVPSTGKIWVNALDTVVVNQSSSATKSSQWELRIADSPDAYELAPAVSKRVVEGFGVCGLVPQAA